MQKAWTEHDEKQWLKSNKNNKEVLKGALNGYEKRTDFIGMNKDKLVAYTKQLINLK